MLVAVSSGGRRQVASASARTDVFHCPACGDALVVRIPAHRVPHFAHRPGSKCSSRMSKAARAQEARRRNAAAKFRRRTEEAEAAGQDALFDIETPGEHPTG